MSPAGPIAAAEPAMALRDAAGVRAPASSPRASSPGRASPRRTALAFVCAPAAPALLAALVAAGVALPTEGAASAIGWLVGLGAALMFGGYVSALLIALPIYCMLLRRRAIPPALSILLGGVAAAAPWATAGVLSGDRTLLLLASATFGLGCVGGLVFALVRDGWPRAGAGAAGRGGA